MTRAVEEWVGKTDDAKVPDRVKVRVLIKAEGICASCTRRIMGAARQWECDHIVSLINGGKHAESNLQVLCANCHKSKTADDVAIKSKTYAMQKRHLGLRKSRWRAMPGTKRSGIKRRMDGTVERR